MNTVSKAFKLKGLIFAFGKGCPVWIAKSRGSGRSSCGSRVLNFDSRDDLSVIKVVLKCLEHLGTHKVLLFIGRILIKHQIGNRYLCLTVIKICRFLLSTKNNSYHHLSAYLWTEIPDIFSLRLLNYNFILWRIRKSK